MLFTYVHTNGSLSGSVGLLATETVIRSNGLCFRDGSIALVRLPEGLWGQKGRPRPLVPFVVRMLLVAMPEAPSSVLVTTSKALVTTSVAPVTTSFLLLLVRHLLLLAWHLLLVASIGSKMVEFYTSNRLLDIEL